MSVHYRGVYYRMYFIGVSFISGVFCRGVNNRGVYFLSLSVRGVARIVKLGNILEKFKGGE